MKIINNHAVAVLLLEYVSCCPAIIIIVCGRSIVYNPDCLAWV